MIGEAGAHSVEQKSHDVEMKEHETTATCQKKPTKLRNLIYKTEAFDSLHVGNAEVHIMKKGLEVDVLFFFTFIFFFFFFHSLIYFKNLENFI